MTTDLNPYEPSSLPEEAVVLIPSLKKTANLDQQCIRSLWFSMAGFLVPSALIVLAMVGVVRVHWDSIVIPLVTLVLGLIHFFLATGFSIYCCYKQRGWRPSLATLIAICSLPYWIFTAWLLAMSGLGSHPV